MQPNTIIEFHSNNSDNQTESNLLLHKHKPKYVAMLEIVHCFQQSSVDEGFSNGKVTAICCISCVPCCGQAQK